jgi:hypothetical protein
VTLTWSTKWNPHSGHPNIRRTLIVEQPIIRLKGAESNFLKKYPKRTLESFSKRKTT